MKPLNLSTPHLIIMTGIPGSGKSFFAEHFSSTFKAPYVNFEKIRQQIFENPVYSNDEQAVVSRIVDYMLDELFKTNQTIVFEGPADTRTSRLQIAKKARDNGYNPMLVWVQTESIAAKARATKVVKGSPAISKERFDTIISKFNAPSPNEKPLVISGKHTYASQLKIVLGRLITRNDRNTDRPSDSGIVRSRQIIIR